ncbi:MAG: aspartate--ammonia ligase, partial [Bacteroidales bacterium]|nr:aspartate--ammonia ligase [Bacteroidales bacterium]
MSYLIIPKGYKSALTPEETERGIKLVKDFFQQSLSKALKLRRVTAPLFVLQGQGINDDLSGVERAVSFPVKDLDDARAEVVHSLAKWKRLSLSEYKIRPGHGIYTDMNAIRADESLGNLHSLYVDQWDWERTITASNRNLGFLRRIVRQIYSAMLDTEEFICTCYPQLRPFLTRNIHFIHSEELLQMYPGMTAKEREDAICR